MNITKKIGVSLFALIASIFMVNNVYAADDFYTITIDESDVVTVTKTSGETTTNVEFDTIDPYTIEGVLSYNTETDLLTIDEGVKISSIKTPSNLTITSNNKEIVINHISLEDETALEIINSKISYDDNLGTIIKSWTAQDILIENSEINVPKVSIMAYDDLFVDASTVKANDLSARNDVLKVTDSTIEALSLSAGQDWGDIAQGMDWLTPDDYIFMNDNGRAYYAIILDNSKINLVGESQASISSKRGILVQNTTINDTSKLNKYINYTISAGNSGADLIENTRAINIVGSTVNINGKLSSTENMDIVITDSKVNVGSSITTDTGSPTNSSGGNLTIKNSEVSSKAYVDTSNAAYSNSAIMVDGNLTIEKSKILADAKDTDMVAIAYSGELSLDDESIGLNEDGKELIKDIDISDIEYNRRAVALDENKKIYTIGYSTDEGKTVVTDESDVVRIGEGVEITITIENGTWSDGTKTPIVLTKLVGDELTEEDLPTGMKSTNGSTKGSWSKTLPLTLTEEFELTYTFEMENPNTSDNVVIYLTLGFISIVTLVSVLSLRKRFQ